MPAMAASGPSSRPPSLCSGTSSPSLGRGLLTRFESEATGSDQHRLAGHRAEWLVFHPGRILVSSALQATVATESSTMGRRTIKLEMNRVEGDVEIRLEVEGHTIVDAWCVGTTYRGYEQILVGRDPKDVLVIAPRICGICSTSQLYAATTALEVAYQSPIAPNGIRIRNLCLMAESIMNDARHTFLMFAPDFCNTAYRDHELYGRS